MLRCRLVIELDNQRFIRSNPVGDLLQITIFHHDTMIDDDQPFAKFLYVAQIMRCQNDRGISDTIDLFYELAKGILGGNIQTDRGLIKKEDLGRMQHRGNKISLYSLPKGHLSHRFAHNLLDPKDLIHNIEGLIIVLLIDLINVLQ